MFAIRPVNGIETLVVTENRPSVLRRFWMRTSGLFLQASQRLRVRRDRGPIDTVEALAQFNGSRAAFVAQKKLYGYLKARMGMRYPSMFEDDVFVESINIAKWHVFAACLSDITVHTVARVVAAGELSADEGRRLALSSFEAGLESNRADLPDETMPSTWQAAFAERLSRTHWENLSAGADALTESPKALYRWAPIDVTLKRYDREIVENSIRFAWAEVTRDFRRRVAPAAIASDLRAHLPDRQ